MRKTRLALAAILLTTLSAWAQVPASYYSAARGKSGSALKTALHGIITNHTTLSYDYLFTVYAESDIRADGKIWDMYSDMTNFAVGDHSSYHAEGDCYNREHSVPQSWFNKAAPMRTDAFHVIPTDGYVNNRRSNYPYGETTRPTYTSHGSFSKVGPCSLSGYSGTVFEPNDMYKGDIARIYFYMVTCYEDKVTGWSSAAFGSSKYTGMSDWTMQMMRQWAEDDPVSQKEIDRNNAVYKFQKNRNPFVDFPGLEEYVWGSKTGVAFDPDAWDASDDRPTPPEPVFSIPSGVVAEGTEVDIESPNEEASLWVSVNGANAENCGNFSTVTIFETTHVTAYCELNGKRSPMVSADYVIAGTEPPVDEDGNRFVLVKAESELKAGDKYLIVCEQTNKSGGPDQVALSAQSNDIRSWAEVSATGGIITTQTAGEYPHVLTLGGARGAWTFYDASENAYLALSSKANKLHALEDANSDNAKWSIEVTADGTHIYNVAYDDREIQFNPGSPRFACYTGSQRPVALYRMDVQTGIDDDAYLFEPTAAPVYDLQGRRARHTTRGVFIQDGRVIVR
ncbi:MAG: endonuclease [Alloprevotella sp.]|nr:endonuclease [Alloprevotella sp.]